MTPDYAALAQRLREIVPFSSPELRARANADLYLAASALDRLAGMETALRGLVDTIHERAYGDDPDRNVYLEELEAELATARRALEGAHD